MSTFITRLDSKGTGPRVAVKDLIDVAGVATTAGSRALAKSAVLARSDAPCLEGTRAADARIVGKTNLHELAMLPLGTNPWFGTPVNPLDPALIPGGSSSGSAVAVATDEADVAFGSDTGGSVRVPSACCGTTGLKTTYGRISRDGVWPLAPSLDTIGPMARTVAGVTLGMQLLEPGFTPSASPARRIGRVVTTGLPEIEHAVNEALLGAEFEIVPVELTEWDAGVSSFTTIFFCEAWECDHKIAEQNPDDVGEDIAQFMRMAEMFKPLLADARAQQETWRASLTKVFEEVELLALPTLPIWPPRLEDLKGEMLPLVIEMTKHVSPFNSAGTPCLAQPIRARGSSLPASLQLVAPWDGEELLLATGLIVESAAGA